MTATSITPKAVSDLSVREMRRMVVTRWLYRFSAVAGWLGLIVAWYAFSVLVLDTHRLPQPHVVLAETWIIITEHDFAGSVRLSLTRVLAGFVLAAAASMGLGILIAHNSWWRQYIGTIVGLVVSTPIMGVSILALMVFGVSSLGPILTVMLVATPYIMANVAQGISGADNDLIVMSESFGRTRMQIIGGVLIPSSLLAVLGGLRLAFAVAWRMELLTEVFASAGGVGFQIRRSFESYDLRQMLGWTLLIVVVMLLFENLVFRQIERWLENRHAYRP